MNFCFLKNLSIIKDETLTFIIGGNNLGENIRKERLNLGFSQEKIAEHLNTSQSLISKYEMGHKNPRCIHFIRNQQTM
ncbi:helix-turn-helix domain-containing protein [Fructilactobacillus frigidiflavus]|uniref:helix-turn-helix domain-containing protein n=1 Tax=Fructilactobacillus frigidiflavus TaxID=3242688 RepID=UPI00375684DD